MNHALNSLVLLLFIPNLGTSAGTVLTESYQRVDGMSCLPVAVVDSAVLDVVLVSSVVECGQRCSKHSACSIFAFSASSRTCHVVSEVTLPSSPSGQCEQGGGEVWRKSPVQAGSPTCQNGGVIMAGGGCQCFNGYLGRYCERLMEDCMEALDSGQYPNMSGGTAKLMTAKPSLSPHNVTVMCRGNGFTMILRQNQQLSEGLNFTWTSYLTNFSLPKLGGAYWMGLRNLYYFTNSKTYGLCVYIRLSNRTMLQIRYRDFVITDDVTFTASLGPYVSGPAGGDLLGDIHGAPFSTRDHATATATATDTADININTLTSTTASDPATCASERGGGWWYSNNGCSAAYNLVGRLAMLTTDGQNENLDGLDYVHYGDLARAGDIKLLSISLEPQ